MAEDKPRYSRLSDIIDIAIWMASEPLGITINDIKNKYGVSRRTAERMRDSLTNIFSEIDEIECDDENNYKHWGFTTSTITKLISFTPEEIASIEQQQRRTTNEDAKKELASAVQKMKALTNKNKMSINDTVELFMQTEGYAVRQMPQYIIETNVLDIIRKALQTTTMITGTYHDKERLIEPLGLLYGEKVYLVAREKAKGKDVYTYLLHKFDNIKLTDQTFDKGDFNLQEYTKQSFGIYQGEKLNVVLSFDKETADDALKYNFHPTQKVKQEEDGTVTVKFKASGSLEIIWHVFKWGKHCKIVAPKSLKNDYKKYLQENLDNIL